MPTARRASPLFACSIATIALFVAGCAGTHQALPESATRQDITPEILDGTKWTGVWENTKRRSDAISVEFTTPDTATVQVEDGGNSYSWVSDAAISADNRTLTLTPRTVTREETYALYDVDGRAVLDGTYTYKGEHWGTIRLSREAGDE